MAFLDIKNVRIAGIAACAPKHIEDNLTIPVFREGEAERVIAQTGIKRKHTVPDNSILASDMALAAAERLIDCLQWKKESIEALCFVSLSQDYREPPTACILQGRLGLPETCMTIDINQGCSGWINGLSVLSGLVSSGNIKRALLLNGDTSSLLCSSRDKESRPLFGDGSAATAVEYSESAKSIYFDFGTRGKDFKAILTKSGGMRYPIDEEALKFKEYGENVIRRDKDSTMDGIGVFAFALTTAPKSVKCLCEKYGIDIGSIDYFLMNQTNMYLNEKIRKTLKIPAEKTPYAIEEFGNTSSASIPLTIVSRLNEQINNKPLKVLGVAFGVGLALGSIYFETDGIVCPELILI